jgi:radical SAM protein with 4Fe4S-binding SPASM domain
MFKLIRYKINNCGLKINYNFKQIRTPFLPTAIDIEPNNYCNFKCEHCQVTYFNKAKKDLDLESLKIIISNFPNLHYVNLQGMGEPMLNKNFASLLEYICSKNIKTEFTTNGSFYNENVWKRILNLQNLKIKFSIDGGTKEVFEKVRNGSNYDKVVENIKKIMQLRKEKKEPNISFWTLLTNKNITNLTNIVEIAQKMDIDKITFQTSFTDWGKEMNSEIKNRNKIDLNSFVSKNEIDKAQKSALKYGIKLVIYYDDYFSQKKKCHWTFSSAYIASNGDVLPCCILSDAELFKMGNLFENNFRDIWNSEKYLNFRRSIKTHNLKSCCKNCYID